MLMLAASSPSRNAFMIVECGAQPVELTWVLSQKRSAMGQESAIEIAERTNFKLVHVGPF